MSKLDAKIQEFKKCLEECVDLMIGIESITSDEVFLSSFVL